MGSSVLVRLCALVHRELTRGCGCDDCALALTYTCSAHTHADCTADGDQYGDVYSRADSYGYGAANGYGHADCDRDRDFVAFTHSHVHCDAAAVGYVHAYADHREARMHSVAAGGRAYGGAGVCLGHCVLDI